MLSVMASSVRTSSYANPNPFHITIVITNFRRKKQRFVEPEKIRTKKEEG